MVAVSVASGCYGHNCDGDVLTFGDGDRPNETGRFVTPGLWETGPIDGAWLAVPKQRAWIFRISDFGGRVPAVITPNVSAQQDPNHDPGGNSTIAAGNLAEISQVSANQFVVHNGTFYGKCGSHVLH